MKNRVLFQGLFFFLNIGATLILSLYAINTWENIVPSSWSLKISMISIVILILQLTTLYIYKISILDFKFWFVLLSHMFLFGQVYVIAIDASDIIFYNIIERYPPELIMKSCIYSLCYLQFLFIGILFYQVKKKHLKLSILNYSFTNIDKNIYNLIRLTGIIILLISFPIKLFNDIKIIISTQAYSSYRAFTVSSGIVDDISYLVVPGVIFLLCGLKDSSKMQKFILLFFIFYFVIFMILTGDRRYSVTGILSIVLTFIYLNQSKIKVRHIVGFGIGSIILLNLLAIIRNIRLDSLTSLSNFIKEYGTSLFKMNPILESLSEFGVTILTVAFAIKNIPNQVPFQEGLSFYGAFPSILPIGWLFGDFFSRVSIFKTLNSMEGYPVGASLPGELYANFGWWGLLVAMLFGYILSKIFNESLKKSSIIYIGVYYSLFYILINLVRSSFVEILRNSIIVSVVPLIILLILNKRSIKR